MTLKKKPLSPHIQIYKPQISSFTSILHRATGIFLYIGTVIIFWVIVHYAYQIEILPTEILEEKICDCSFIKYFLYAVVILWSFFLYYHLCNGIRHLFWDIGKGFDKQTANNNGLLVILASFLLTISSVYYVLFILQ